MHKHSKHSAAVLLGIFFSGAVVVPLLHQVKHAIELVHSDEGEATHTHPDYKALLDGSQHRLNTHIDCILSSSQHRHFLSIAKKIFSFDKQLGYTFIQTHAYVSAVSFGILFVRGPPPLNAVSI